MGRLVGMFGRIVGRRPGVATSFGRRAVLAAFVGFGMVSCASLSDAAALSFASNSYTQNFDGLQCTSNQYTTAQDFGIASSPTEGWYMTTGSAPAASARNSYVFRYDSFRNGFQSGCPAGGLPGTDRSIGYRSTVPGALGLFLTNNHSQTIQDAQISFNIEVWQPLAVGTTITSGWLNYLVKSDGPSDTDVWAGFTDLSQQHSTLSFTVSKSSKVGDLQPCIVTLSNLNWHVGDTLALRWNFSPYSGNSYFATGLDDVSVSVPEPAVMMVAFAILAALPLRPVRRHE